HGHQVIGQADQQRYGNPAAAGVCPRPAFGRHRTAHDQGAAVVVQLASRVTHLLRAGAVRLDPQPPFDGGPVRSGADPRRVGPAAEHQAEARHDHGLAGPGLAGHHGEPGRELEDGILDHPEAGDPDFLKHRRREAPSPPMLRPRPPPRPNRGPGGPTAPPPPPGASASPARQRVSRPPARPPAPPGRGHAPPRGPGAGTSKRLPPATQKPPCRPWPAAADEPSNSTASIDRGETTMGPANSACALMGTISNASTSGHTIGPPAE